MGDVCFQSWEGAGGLVGWYLGGCPACWWRRLALLPHCGSSNELRVWEREAGCGWIPDGLSGLPTVDCEAPLVSAAPSALTQLHGQSPLWNGSDTQPALPAASPSPPLHWRQCISSLLQRVRAGNLADGWAPSSGSLTSFPLGSSCIRFWVQILMFENKVPAWGALG